MYVVCSFMQRAMLRVYAQSFQETKKREYLGIEPMILCILATCFDRYATSVNEYFPMVGVLVNSFYLEVGDARPAQDRQPPPPPP